MGTLLIRVFGTLSLERDGQQLGKFPSRRVRDLLGYLIMNRELVQSREFVAGLLWGDVEDRKARHCLNTALWRLQKVLADPENGKSDYLLVDSQSLAFNERSDVWIDLLDFERCSQWAEQLGESDPVQRAQLYSRAVSLYSGPVLPECYDDWALIERERVHHLYIRALAWLMKYFSEREEYEQAIQFGRKILSQDPLREEVHRDLIDLLVASHRPAEALRQYQECERVLERELGITPMDETQDRLRLILQMRKHQNQNRASVSNTSSNPGSFTAVLGEISRRTREFDEAYNNLRRAVDRLESLVEEPARASQPPSSGHVTVPSAHPVQNGFHYGNSDLDTDVETSDSRVST